MTQNKESSFVNNSHREIVHTKENNFSRKKAGINNNPQNNLQNNKSAAHNKNISLKISEFDKILNNALLIHHNMNLQNYSSILELSGAKDKKQVLNWIPTSMKII